MKKMLFGILALSICCTACKKDKEETAPPPDLEQPQVVATWKISSDPVVQINDIPGFGAMKTKMVDTLKYLFHKDDVYLFKENNTVEVTRNGNKAPFPTQYTLDKHYIVFDGSIKVSGTLGGDTFKLVAGKEEIRFTIGKMILSNKNSYYSYFPGLSKPEDLTQAIIDDAMLFIDGKLEITLQKQ